ncbi:Protein transport protein Sec24B [Temnothorax longispinosus]|uniref:Protein transport protein Sec24B n=1 Tax=Temnothorax longispinosus TaxID=300112 RepID=A0A4S2KM37_9HYME|nr:Protein transport protein Sec24B [Temnothorax longispinosus]
MNQSYQWATNPPPTNIPQGTMGVPGMSSSIDKTSQVSTDQTAESQTSFARVNKIVTYDQGHPTPPPASNANLPPSNITQHLNQNSYVQQEPMSSSTQPPRTQNVQAQSTISPSESLSSSQLRYGTQQNISNASSMPNSSTQNLFYSAQGHNVGPRNPQDYSTQPLKPQNLLTGYMDPTGLGSIPQGQNVHQNLTGQRRYPQQQDTANTAMLPPSGGNQLHGYDPRSQYPGPMTNVPLDSSNRRYPNMYPDQLNQLNNQMSNLNVTQTGYNKLWGVESIDLLQCRNILPPEKVEPPKIKLHQEMLDVVNYAKITSMLHENRRIQNTNANQRFEQFRELLLLKLFHYIEVSHEICGIITGYSGLLTGTNYTVGWVPTELKEATYRTLLAHCALLKDHYEHNGHSYVLNANR